MCLNVSAIECIFSPILHTLENKRRLYTLFPSFCQCLLSIFNVPGPMKGDSNIVIYVLRKTHKRAVEMGIF